MKRRSVLLKLSLLFSLVVILLPLTTLLAEKKHSQETSEFRISNQTTGLAVSKAETIGKTVRLSLRNDYKKTIRAFAISPPGQNGYHTLHILPDDADFAPGSLHDETIGLSSDRIGNEITVLAVVFTDNTADGDQTPITEINDYLTGKKIQSRRIISILNHLLVVTDKSLAPALSDARIAIADLPSGTEQESPHMLLAGLRDTKQAALINLERLDEEGKSERAKV
jgi:hypothetical protein